MFHKCCIVNCENNKDVKDKKFSLFLIPKDIKLRNKWLKIISKINGKVVKPTQRICEKHFHPNDIQRSYSCWQNETIEKVNAKLKYIS